MNKLATIISATRKSAAALESRTRFEREIIHANRTIAWHARMVSRGLMSPDAAAKGDALCIGDKNRAMRNLDRAIKRYQAANLTLIRNPI
jgi:hypothetical protein